MKKLLMIWLMGCWLMPGLSAQFALLGGYNFAEGGYALVGTFADHGTSPLLDSLGEFYTDDISLMQEISQAWTFQERMSDDMCGDDYDVAVCKGGKAVSHVWINLQCRRIHSRLGWFQFDPQLLRMFSGRLKRVVSKTERFKTVAEGRAYRLRCLADDKLLLTQTPNWVATEGYLKFRFDGRNEKGACDRYGPKNLLKTRIHQAFPKERFELHLHSGQGYVYEFYLYCNRSLADHFELYPIVEGDEPGTWRPLDAELTTYWRREQ